MCGIIWLLAITFLWPELEIFSERKMLDAQVWHQIPPSWWRSRSVVSGGTLDSFQNSVTPYKMTMIETSTLTMFDSFCLINSAMFIGFRHSWGYLFNNDPGRYLCHWCIHQVTWSWKLRTEVVELVASILPIVGLFQVFDGWSAVTAGILRAKGEQVLTFTLFFRNSWTKLYF